MTARPKKPARAPRGAGAEVMAARSIRMTDEQWEKLERIGGAKWLRMELDSRPMPPPPRRTEK